jgi:hypothetical protein
LLVIIICKPGTSLAESAGVGERTVGDIREATRYDRRALNQRGPTGASFVYNGDGLRISKTVSGATTNYTLDPIV